MLKSSLRRVLFVLNYPLATLWKDLEFLESPHFERKKVKTTRMDVQQSELEPRTPRSIILSLST